MLGQSELTLSHRLHELFGLFSEAFRHSLRFFRAESLQLIEERHLFDFFLGIFFHFRSLPRNFRLINLAFTLRGEIRPSSHGESRSEHARQTRYEYVMLLVIGRARDAGNDSEHRAQSVICAVNRVGYPAATPPMPALAFQNCVKGCLWTSRRSHRAQRPRVRLLLDCALAKKIPDIVLSGQRPLGLISKFRFVPFFRCFHSANSYLCAGDFIPPTV